MLLHAIFDILAWGAAAAAYFFIKRHLAADGNEALRAGWSYRAALIAGAAIGAYAFGSFNLWLSGMPGFGRSIEGALAGGIAGVELYKWRAGISARTGAAFVLPLAVGIAVGRIGCLLAGLEDFTHGGPTGMNWGWDFGDGILRHPVQLYESVAMGLYALIYCLAVWRGRGMFLTGGFGLVVGFYGAQRFVWEFLKPYASVIGPLTVFHLLSAALVIYGIWWLRAQNHERVDATAR